MKKNSHVSMLFLTILVIFAASTPIFLQSYQIDGVDPVIPFLNRRYVSPLRKDPPQTHVPDVQTGIISTGATSTPNAPRLPRLEIVNQQPAYFPGNDIQVRNRFSSAQTGPYAVLNQTVSIYLHKQGYSSLRDPNHWLRNETTNFTSPIDGAPFSTDPQQGWIDITFQIPTISELATYGISAGDNVTIYQYCDPRKTYLLESVNPIAFADNFSLNAFTLVGAKGTGFVNPASGDNTFRQGENATATIRVFSGSENISNVPITTTLYDSSNNLVANNTNGITYYLTNTSGDTQTSTDGNGELLLFVNTTYPTVALDSYYFNITADLFGSGYFSRFYDSGTPTVNIAFNTTDFNFTVQNEWDTIDLQLISALPQPLYPPDQDYTIVTFRVRAKYEFGIPSPYYYYPENMPVNATLNSYPIGVTLSKATGFNYNGSTNWVLTNASGYVAFNITAVFPDLYLDDIIKNITGVVNLQNDSAPIYPYHTSPSPQPHRFMRDASNGVNATWTEAISIDPDFWVGNIHLASYDATTIRPGDTANLVFEVNSTQSPGTPFSGVPVNITLNQPIAGVSLSSSRPVAFGGWVTNSTGHVDLSISTTYLTTPEVPRTIVLDIRVDFENDSNDRWIGTKNAGNATIDEFNTTWRTAQSSFVRIHPQFTNFSVALFATNETGDDTTIRPGDGLTVTFMVQEIGGPGNLTNVPVNISLDVASRTAGVSVTTITAAGYDRVGYNFTTSAGLITVELATSYGITPKYHEINLNVTADFENDTGNSVWEVGQRPTGVNFKSDSSYSNFSTNVTVAPQYFTGEIYVPGGNNPNATLVQQEETIRIEFKLRLNYSGTNYASSVTGVNISVQVNNTDPATWFMRVLNVTLVQSRYQNSVASSVIFYIQTNDTGTTPEADYNITATADFLAAKGLTYNVIHSTVPTGMLQGTWVNGSANDDNSTFTQLFRVENIDRISIQVESITDFTYSDAGLNAGFYEVYRDTTQITINGTYQDATQQTVNFVPITIAYNYTNGVNPYILKTESTDGVGFFRTTIVLNDTVPLKDIDIYAFDPQAQEQITFIQFRVVTPVTFSGHARSGAYNGTAVYVGETVSVAGTLRDDQGVIINSSELTNRLRLIGWNATNQVEIGTPVPGNPNGVGDYSLTYQVPLNFLGDTLYIRLNLTWNAAVLHYRTNYKEFPIPIYRDFQLSNPQIYFPFTRGTVTLTNNTIYLIKGIENRTFNIYGNLNDSSNRWLGGKEINHRLGTTAWRGAVNSNGFFNNSYSFTGWVNATFIWTLYHITDAGTNLTTHYNLTLQWEIYDTMSPSITVTSPTGFDNTSTLANISSTRINATIFDPNSTTSSGYVSLGLNISSVTILINGTSPIAASMVSVGGDTFSYTWDTSSVENKIYNITIVALDNTGNERRLLIFVVVDIVKPIATLNVPINPFNTDTEYVQVDSQGNVVVTGTITDNTSVGGRQSGINATTISLRIQDGTGFTILTLNSTQIGFNTGSGSFSYTWYIFNITTLRRNPQFMTSPNWIFILDYDDLAGNTNSTQQSVNLDDVGPKLNITTPFPSIVVNDTEDLVLSFSDDESDIDLASIRVDLVSTVTSQTIFSLFAADLAVTSIGGNFSLDFTTVTNGVYVLNITVFDRTGNLNYVSTQFRLERPLPTTPPTTPPTEPPGGPLLGSFDIFQFILFDLAALGVGVGLAVVYERLKAMRRPA